MSVELVTREPGACCREGERTQKEVHGSVQPQSAERSYRLQPAASYPVPGGEQVPSRPQIRPRSLEMYLSGVLLGVGDLTAS